MARRRDAVVFALVQAMLAGHGPVAAAASPPVNTNPPVISGSAQDGQTLSTSPGSWSAGGPITYRYQWRRCTATGAGCVNIAAATAVLYRLTSTDVTHEITVTVTATSQKLSTPATATPVGPVGAPPAPVNTSLPVISGTTADGQTLTSGTGTWSSPDPLVYRYQWQRCDGTGAGCLPISGATKNTFKMSTNDVGHELSVVVTAVDKESQTAMKTAGPVGPVGKPPPPAVTAVPLVSGTAQDGQTVTTTNGSWSSPDALTYTRTWQRCDAIGGACVRIAGVAGNSYHLSSADAGRQVTVMVSATDREGQSTPASAAPIGPVAAPPPPVNTTPPVVSGVVKTAQTLSVTDGSWSSPDALTYTFQWRRCDSTGGGCVDLAGQTTPYYEIADGDLGDEIEAVVGATDAEGQLTTVTIGPIGPVAQGSPLTGIHRIQHVVVIMQENRSFDNYFGTYPGADGIPAGVCEPDPYNGGCVAPFHDTADVNLGGPHGMPAAIADIHGGAMDGFVGEAESHCGTTNLICKPCTPSEQDDCIDVMGYHDGGELPNYWTYAKDFVLQDRMFVSITSSSGPSHLYQVSGWSAHCTNPLDPTPAESDQDRHLEPACIVHRRHAGRATRQHSAHERLLHRAERRLAAGGLLADPQLRRLRASGRADKRGSELRHWIGQLDHAEPRVGQHGDLPLVG